MPRGVKTYYDLHLGRQRPCRRLRKNRDLRTSYNADNEAKREAIRARLAFEKETEQVSKPYCELEDKHA